MNEKKTKKTYLQNLSKKHNKTIYGNRYKFAAKLDFWALGGVVDNFFAKKFVQQE